MAVNVPNPGVWQQQLGNQCTTFRDALQALLNEAAWLSAVGGATFLTTAQPDGLGLSQADADAIMTTIGAVTPANSTVQAIQTWLDSTQFLWGSK